MLFPSSLGQTFFVSLLQHAVAAQFVLLFVEIYELFSKKDVLKKENTMMAVMSAGFCDATNARR